MVYSRSALSSRWWWKCYIVCESSVIAVSHVSPLSIWNVAGGVDFYLYLMWLLSGQHKSRSSMSIFRNSMCVFIFPEKAVFDSLMLSLPSLSLVRETLSLKQLPLKSFPPNTLPGFMKTAWGGTSLVVQGLGLCASSAGNSGSIPG